MVTVKKSGKGASKRKPAPKVTQNDTPKKADAAYKPRVWMKAFISILSEQGNVSRACEAASIERKTAYRAKESDPVFAEAWADALDVAADALEAEAWRRAVEGVEKPVGFYQGTAGEYVREYSDTLLIFMLKGARPEKYRDNVKLEHGGTIETKLILPKADAGSS